MLGASHEISKYVTQIVDSFLILVTVGRSVNTYVDNIHNDVLVLQAPNISEIDQNIHKIKLLSL